MPLTNNIDVQLTKLAWRNVVRNWRHSLATIMAIASGFMAVSLFDGFIKELNERNTDGYMTRGMLGNVLIVKKGAQENSADDQWQYSMDAKDQKFMEGFFARDPDFKVRVRFLSMQGLVTSGAHNTVFAGFGYDIKEGAEIRGQRWYWNTLSGKPIDLAEKPSILLGMGLGHLIDCDFPYDGPSFILPDGNYTAQERPYKCQSERVTLSATTEAAQVNAIDLPIVGFFDAGFREADKRALHVSLADAQRLLDTDKITMVAVKLKDDNATDAFVKRMKAAAKGEGVDLDIMPWMQHQMAAYVSGGMQIVNVFRNLFMVIVVTIGVMSVANTMMKSVNERIREIGTLRSLGFLRRHLVKMFAMEGAFLSLLACGVGLVMTLVMTFVIARLGLTYRAGILSIPIALHVQLVPMAWLVSAITLSLLATGTAWFCSRRAAQMVIADAMRHV